MRGIKLIYAVNIFAWLITSALLISCSTGSTHVEPELLRADSLITAQQPDSAWQLLQSHLPSASWTDKETARYALLWAAATDKCVKSLLPCDSLLDVALDYYDRDSKERAIALLYKGRLEMEMEQSERAVNFFLEGLGIIEKYPEELEIKRHLLCSLGNEYMDANLYEKAGKTYREFQKYCFTDKDKAIALNRLGAYYATIEKKDSAFICQFHALKHAKQSNDSTMISTIALNISAEYSCKENNDSALYYAKLAIHWLPFNENKSIYYNNIGGILYDKEEKDSAEYYINKAKEHNTDINGKASILLNLSYIKAAQQDYEACTDILYQFIELADSIYLSERATDIQQLIHQYDIQNKIKEEKEKNKNLIRHISIGFIFITLFIAFFFQIRINKRKRQQLINKQRFNLAQKQLAILQDSIKENLYTITLLKKEKTNFKQETESLHKEISTHENRIQKLEEEKETLRTWLFEQSDIYKKIYKLSEQKVISKKELKVLTTAEQSKLKKTVWEIYSDYISEQQIKHAKLTDEDILYLCMSRTKLSNLAIALCFGHTDTHALAQRKYRLKERMKE